MSPMDNDQLYEKIKSELQAEAKAQNGTWSEILKWLPLLLAIVTIIGSYTTMSQKVSANEKAMTEHKEEFKDFMEDMKADIRAGNINWDKLEIRMREVEITLKIEADPSNRFKFYSLPPR